MTHVPGQEYDGPAHVGEHEIDVRLRGHLEPIDGRFHWWGRVAADERLSQRPGAQVTLRTPYGEAAGTLSDLDPWGRFRISGLGRPPF